MLLHLIELAFPDEPDKHELLERLYIDYHRLMLGVAYGILHNTVDAEDAVQQAFVQIIGAIGSVERIKDARDERSYMAVCAKYAAINLAAKRYNKHEVATDPERIRAIHWKQASERDFERYSSSYISRYLEMLKPAYRDILFLKFSCELKDHEIAKIIGQDRSTVSKRIKRALNKLKELVDGAMEVTDNE